MDIRFSKDLRVKKVNPEEELPRHPIEYVQPIQHESMCGSDDFQDVEKYDGNLGVPKEFVQKHQAPVGQIQWNKELPYSNPGDVADVRWGSGTLISNDLFLTAGHCFDSSPNAWTVPRINNTNNPILPKEIALNMKVNFNYQFNSSGELKEESFKIVELVEYREGKLDYAIVRLDGKPGEKYGYTKVSKFDAKEKDMLCIIQHPDGQPKKVEAGECTYIKGDERIGYNSIDTLGGSSGAGILHYVNGDLVGVHTNGGCHSSREGFNYGVRITSLLEVSRILKNLISN